MFLSPFQLLQNIRMEQSIILKISAEGTKYKHIPILVYFFWKNPSLILERHGYSYHLSHEVRQDSL